MALKLVCAETGAKCPFEVVAESKEELMEHVGIHAKMAHPERTLRLRDAMSRSSMATWTSLATSRRSLGARLPPFLQFAIEARFSPTSPIPTRPFAMA